MELSNRKSKLNQPQVILPPLRTVTSMIKEDAKCIFSAETFPVWQADLELIQHIYERGDFPKAQNLLDKAIGCLGSLLEQAEASEDKNQLSLFLGRARTLQGLIAQRLGESRKALEFFEQAIMLFGQCWSSVECDATSQDYRDYATSLNETGHTQEAINLIQEAVHNSIVTPELYLQLGVMLKKQKQYKEAEQILKKGLNQAPSNPYIQKTLAQIFEIQGRDREASELYQSIAFLFTECDQLEQALDAINQSLKLASDNFHILSFKAEILSRLNRQEEALRTLNQALSYEPENNSLLASKGAVLIALGQYQEALAILEQVLSSSDQAQDVFTLGNKGRALSLLGRYEEAATVFCKLIKQYPNFAWMYAELGEALRQMGQGEKALVTLDQALTLEPNNLLALKNKGILLIERERYTEALQVVNHALSLTPNDSFLVRTKGKVLNALDKSDEALQILDRFLATQPDDAFVLGTKGLILGNLNRNEEAIKFLEQAVKINPELGWVYVSLGEKYRDLGRYDQALTNLDHALELLPNDIYALGSKGAVLTALQQHEEALQVLDQALKLQPRYQFALAYKGIALRNLEQIDRAIEVLTRAVNLSPAIDWVKTELAQTLGDKGAILRKEGKYREAIRCFRQAIKYEPNLTYVYVQRLETLCNSGFYQEALELADRSLQQKEEVSLLTVKGQILNLLRQYQEAEDVLQRAYELTPNSARIHLELARSLHQRDLYQQELDWLNKGLNLDANQQLYSLLLGFKGGALRRLGRYEEAEQMLKQSVAINKDLEIPHESLDIGFDYAWIMVELAKILQRLGRNQQANEEYGKAQEILNQVLELTKGNEILKAKVLGKQGQIFRLLNEYSQAIEVLLDSIAIRENALWIHAELGETYRLLGQYKDSLEEVNKALTIDPTNTQAIGSKGGTLAAIGQYKDALQVLSQAATLPQPDYEFVLKLKAEILSDIAEYQASAQVLEQLIHFNPNDDWLFTLQGWVLIKSEINRIEDAENAYKKALILNPENLWRHKNIAEITYLRGNLQESRAKYQWIIQQAEETNNFDYWLMGWCYYRLGQYSRAADYLNRASIFCLTDDEECARQFDVSLTLICSKRYKLALQEYQTGLRLLGEQPYLRRCGLLSIALIDLRDALNQPHLPHLKLLQVPEAQQALELLEKASSEAESFKSKELQLIKI